MNMPNNKCVVITTIHGSGNNALQDFANLKDFDLIIAGDLKSPEKYELDCTYISTEIQQREYALLNDLIPFNHYARKNFGYLEAIKKGYSLIAESDDDNYPYANWFTIPSRESYQTIISPHYPNVYKHFSDQHVWPRGYPLELILQENTLEYTQSNADVLVWQGLVDGDPDVDAIYRLVVGETLTFKANEIVVLEQNVISPFNTQNTLWQKEAHYLLYLPFSVNFRYTDILRSFVAQFGVWALDGRIGFVSPTVFQKRNEHNLMDDFNDEVQMHSCFHQVMDILKNCQLNGDSQDLVVMYHSLHQNNIVSEQELRAVTEWVNLYNTYNAKTS